MDNLKYDVVETGQDGPGKSWVVLECPCCGREVKAFRWSLSGSGKRCPCGAKHTTAGTRPSPTDPGPWGAGASWSECHGRGRDLFFVNHTLHRDNILAQVRDGHLDRDLARRIVQSQIFRVPPVCTAYWASDDWNRFEDDQRVWKGILAELEEIP